MAAMVSEAVGESLERKSHQSLVGFLNAEWGPSDPSAVDEVKVALKTAEEMAPWPD